MTAKSPDLNCALYLWRLHVFNDYNVTSMEGLLTFIQLTRNPSHRYAPPPLLKQESNSRAFADVYPPYEEAELLQAVIIIAVLLVDAALLIWIAGSVLVFWQDIAEFIINPMEGRYIVCK